MPALPWKQISTPEPNTEYVVMGSSLPVRGYRFIPRFLLQSLRVRRQLAGTPGLVGYGLDARLAHKEFRTVSVWTSERGTGAVRPLAPTRRRDRDEAPAHGHQQVRDLDRPRRRGAGRMGRRRLPSGRRTRPLWHGDDVNGAPPSDVRVDSRLGASSKCATKATGSRRWLRGSDRSVVLDRRGEVPPKEGRWVCRYDWPGGVRILPITMPAAAAHDRARHEVGAGDEHLVDRAGHDHRPASGAGGEPGTGDLFGGGPHDIGVAAGVGVGAADRLELGPGETGAQGGDHDAARPQFLVERLAERRHERFRRGVDGEVGSWLEAGDRARVEHPAPPAGGHRLDRGPGEGDDGRDVEADLGVEVVRRHGGERVGVAEAGVVDQEVDRALGVGQAGDDGGDAVGRGEVGDEGLDRALCVLAGEGGEPVAAAGDHDGGHAGRRELRRHRPADAARGAGDQGRREGEG